MGWTDNLFFFFSKWDRDSSWNRHIHRTHIHIHRTRTTYWLTQWTRLNSDFAIFHRTRLDSVHLALGFCTCLYLLLARSSVSLPVQGQVVRSGEPSSASETPEGLGSGVLPVVTGQLVGTSKTPRAVRPGANVRLLSWNVKKEKK